VKTKIKKAKHLKGVSIFQFYKREKGEQFLKQPITKE